MKKLKLILPLLAFVMAIGLSFAFVGNSPLTTAFINVNGTAQPIQVNPCEGGERQCQVIVESLPNPGPYNVYMDEELQEPYTTDSPTPHVIPN